MLGPHVVGVRVVVRRLVRGETGPSGGPAMTDLLGMCEAFGDGVVVVRPETGVPVTIPLDDVVSGKPVPPRPSARDRVPARTAQLRGFALFPDLVTGEVGAWVLRDSATATARRANSVLAFGPSGVDDDVERVVAHYRRPVAAVLAGSPEDARLTGLGWVPESHEADTLFQVAGTAQVARALRGVDDGEVEVTEDDGLGVARVGEAASGVAAHDQDWVGFRSLEVSPAHRRQGLALRVMSALVGWGAERGATTAYLQVLADNAPALALYDRLGFRTHHRYRYLVPATVR
ncbi:GNAT family N-acetyltransferase [Nocardioides sp. C4-1]|uniref:GNAT family N-acetyltransferase n=1 Tax=Nocardioides sp. C4-1 TaxID=3151851 RepID=UPI003265CAC7